MIKIFPSDSNVPFTRKFSVKIDAIKSQQRA